MTKKSSGAAAYERVLILTDQNRENWAEQRKTIPEAIKYLESERDQVLKAKEIELDQIDSKILRLKTHLAAIPDLEMAELSATPENQAKVSRVAKAAKKKATALQSLGSHLRSLRSEAGMSQAEVARKAKVPQSSLCQFETDKRKPSKQNLQKLAKTFNVSVESLITPQGSLNN